MPTTLTTNANDESTYIITCSFKDEEGSAVAPGTIRWTLTNGYGTVVNNRSDVNVSSPASTIDILLGSDDLKYSDGRQRTLTIEAFYDSSAGHGLPLKDQVSFSINDIVAV